MDKLYRDIVCTVLSEDYLYYKEVFYLFIDIIVIFSNRQTDLDLLIKLGIWTLELDLKFGLTWMMKTKKINKKYKTLKNFSKISLVLIFRKLNLIGQIILKIIEFQKFFTLLTVYYGAFI